ncbi:MULTISPECIES: radical SAM protein [Sphingomonadales]|uniref:radical SAM protein n=1 Tax=Sphingomonadales TaxID=204457 RepID=UPI0006C91E16|nr:MULTISPECIES: radical SAM protein [Sphingomonadales]KPM18295.1 coproporphyrinogen III oxidase [Citromicrobium sp. WPS32]|tara:strand:+ start:130 stop:1443 length:1314 start_codon:yes stop_codon:yes gene_type:complete
MWPYHPELLETPVPRYTSYPTAADFDVLPACHYRTALERTEGDVSLYLHIPFCEQICFYCGCNTGKANKRKRLESYLRALHREIETVAALLPRGTRVRRIAFGGGSPNAIAPVEFLRLIDALTIQFEIDEPVFSIELDPRTMSREWAQVLAAVGVERASLGVQTFAEHCQQAIGRVQPEELIVQTVDWLREAGVSSINFDLMYGLPGQTLDDLEDSMHRTRVLGADRVALFGYAHVPHIVARQRVIDATNLPDRDQRFAMASAGFGYFLTHGYVPVGFDHFAKAGSDPLAAAATSGRVRRNFQGFTDDPSDVLIGLGASAISSFPGLLAQNEKNSGRYRMKAGDGQLTVTRGIHRSADDRYRGAIIERLLCDGRSRVGSRLLAEVTPRLTPFIDRGLAHIDREWLSIEPDGLPYARTIAALFDPYRTVSARQFSSAV